MLPKKFSGLPQACMCSINSCGDFACSSSSPLFARRAATATTPVTLDNGRKFDLTSDSFADDGHVEEGGAARFLRKGQHSSSGGGGGSKRASKAPRGAKNGKRTAGPVEAEFRNK